MDKLSLLCYNTITIPNGKNRKDNVMKKIISAVLVCALLVGCVFALASCSKKLSGTYEADALVAGASYEFKGSKVTITAEVLGFEKSFEGKYEITENDDGDTVIIFTFENDDAEKYDGEFSFSEGEEDGKKYIKIGGVKYVKAD